MHPLLPSLSLPFPFLLSAPFRFPSSPFKSRDPEIQLEGLGERVWVGAEIEFGAFYPHDAIASAGLCESNVSVRLSVTRRYCIKTKKASVMISSPPGSLTILVF